jgi:D-alanyl-lipoteichoic acid acyltransferase DltB (MBOAT superfamily)
MPLTSLRFVALVVALLALCWLTPRARQQNLLLLLASYGFYATWDWRFPLLLATLTTFNFVLALKLRPGARARREHLALGLLGNLGAWLFLRHAGFFLDALASPAASLGLNVTTLGLLLPVGMSFYVLQAVSYLLDVARGDVEACADPLDFALYLAWFPKLLAGPIERARAFLPQLASTRRTDGAGLERGLALIVVGLVRKLVVADTLTALVPATLFTRPRAHAPEELALGLLCYGFALYADFAGYSDIARGLSRLFGIELVRNFEHPFFARNVNDVWNRWHISLSLWLRDYVYMPLTRRWLLHRNRVLSQVGPPLLAMLASGVWHGGSSHMLAWGVLVGTYQVMARLFPHRVLSDSQRSVTMRLLGMASSWVLLIPALVLFRCEPQAAVEFLSGCVRLSGLPTPPAILVFALGVGLWIDWVQHRSRDELVFLRWPHFVQSALLAAAALGIFLATRDRLPAPFVYEGF